MMDVIKGRVATAISYAKEIEYEARDQIRRVCDYEFTRDSKIRIMPDVHAGAGCTIGTTMTVVDRAVPNVVGVDIGCGMYTVELAEREIDLPVVDEAAHYIPSGRDVWDGRQEHFDLTELRCYRQLKDTRRLVRSLGTLGGGNHFIEIDRSSDGKNYLVVHSGSRNLGKQVAEYYQGLAIDLAHGKGELFERQEQLIAEYKSKGKRAQIQSALKELRREFKARASDVPADLCFVYGKYFEQYLHDIELCQRFARRNREMIAKVLTARAGLTAVDAFHTIHNYIDTDEMILRKGAIAAHAGERVLIPINMRDGSILAVGKGNPDWNYSAPHGAGRLMSRSEAKDRLDMEEYRRSMEGIYTTSVRESTLDEAPMAYKALDDILETIEPTAQPIEVLRPIYNFKA